LIRPNRGHSQSKKEKKQPQAQQNCSVRGHRHAPRLGTLSTIFDAPQSKLKDLSQSRPGDICASVILDCSSLVLSHGASPAAILTRKWDFSQRSTSIVDAASTFAKQWNSTSGTSSATTAKTNGTDGKADDFDAHECAKLGELLNDCEGAEDRLARKKARWSL